MAYQPRFPFARCDQLRLRISRRALPRKARRALDGAEVGWQACRADLGKWAAETRKSRSDRTPFRPCPREPVLVASALRLKALMPRFLMCTTSTSTVKHLHRPRSNRQPTSPLLRTHCMILSAVDPSPTIGGDNETRHLSHRNQIDIPRKPGLL